MKLITLTWLLRIPVAVALVLTVVHAKQDFPAKGFVVDVPLDFLEQIVKLTFSAVEGNLCRGERSQRGFALLNATYSYDFTHSFPDCVDLCVDDPRCMSFNFWWKTRKCDLNSKAKEQSCRARFVEEPSSTYMGMARYPALARSCSDLKKLDPTRESGDYTIDPDGEGCMLPFDVTCDMSEKDGVGVTVISHDSEGRTLVNGCNPRGCYSRDIHYTGASLPQLASLTRVSSHCEQFIKYECYHSKMFRDKFAWWVSRDSTKMKNWGGASPNSGKCACGMNNTCAHPKYGCNCDKNDKVWREDSGLLTDKSFLPVIQLRFGDVASHEKGFHTLGKFKCYGIA